MTDRFVGDMRSTRTGRVQNEKNGKTFAFHGEVVYTSWGENR